jgi:hypothetical protein
MRRGASAVFRARLAGRSSGMSYDLYAFPLRPGEDPSEAYERLEEEETGEGDVDVRALVEALVTAVPALTSTGSGEEDEEIELTSPELQLLVSTGSVAISVPYWDSLDRDVLRRRLERVVQTVRSRTGFVVYDPQLERLVERDEELDDVVAAVGAGRAAIDDLDE